MKKPFWIILSIAIVITLLVGSILAYYSIPFVDANNWLISLNKNASATTSQPQKMLKIIEDEFLTDEYGSNIHSKKSIKLEAWNQIIISYNISIEVYDSNTLSVIKEYNEKRNLTYIFSNGSWQCKQAEDPIRKIFTYTTSCG